MIPHAAKVGKGEGPTMACYLLSREYGCDRMQATGD